MKEKEDKNTEHNDVNNDDKSNPTIDTSNYDYFNDPMSGIHYGMPYNDIPDNDGKLTFPKQPDPCGDGFPCELGCMY